MFPLGTNGLIQAAQTIYKQVVDEFNFKMGLSNSSLNHPQLFKFLASVDIRIGDLPSKKLSVNNLFRDIVIELNDEFWWKETIVIYLWAVYNEG